MGFLDALKRTFRREAAEVRDAVDGLSERADEALSRREAELTATPEERLDSIMSEIEASESDFDALRARAADAEGDDD